MNPRIKKYFFYIIPILLLFFLFGFTKEYHWPRAKTWALVNLEKMTAKHLPVRILAKDIQLSFWPPSITLSDLKINPKANLAQKLAPTKIKQLKIGANFFGLFARDFKILNILIESPKITIIHKQRTPSSESFQVPFTELLSYPIKKLLISNMQMFLQLPQKNIISRLDNVNLKVEAVDDRFLMNLSSPEIIIKQKGQKPQLGISIKTQFFASAKSLQISALQIRKGTTFLIASGSIDGQLEKLKISHSNFNVRSYFDLTELNYWAKQTFPKTKLPETNGDLKLDIFVKKESLRPLNINFINHTKNLNINGFQIGDLDFNGNYDLKSLSIPELTIKNSAGTYQLINLNFIPKNTFPFKAKLNLKKVELSKLLQTIKLKKGSTNVDITSALPCSGHLKPTIRIDCNGKVIGENLNVQGTNNSIVKLKKFKVNGALSVTNQSVSYDADLEIDSLDKSNNASKGHSKGVITYDDGFHISFRTPDLNFANIQNLSQLSLEGNGKLKGFIKGNSRTALFEIGTTLNNFWFESLYFGNSSFLLKYKNGILKLNNVDGKLGNSKYNGQLSLNFKKSLIFSEITSPSLFGQDVQKLISRKLKLPANLLGDGNAKLKIWGPLKKDSTNYTYDLNLKRGAFASESFDKLSLSVATSKGITNIKQLSIAKGASEILLSGNSKGEKLDIKITGRNILLEDSQFIQQTGLKLKSQLDFIINSNGPVDKLNTQINGYFSKTLIGDYPIDVSSFNLNITPKYITGSGLFFGKIVQSEFKIPLIKNGDFKLKTNFNNLNFIPFFGLINESINSLNYESNLNAQIDLQSTLAGPLKSSGKMQLNDFKISRENQNIQSVGISTITLKNGIANAPLLQLKGLNSFIKSTITNSSEKNIDASINGQFDLSLLAFASPLIEDLRGPVSFSFKLGGNKKNPEFLGSLFVDKGFLKLANIPHAFEEIKADILLSHSKLVINSFKSLFASGNLFSEGRVVFKSWQNYPTNINLSATNLNLEFPEKVQTKGSANINLSGKWFPFNINGNIDIDQSIVKREINEKKQAKSVIKSSPFLPSLILKKQNFNPANFNVKVNIKDFLSVENSLLNGKFNGNLLVTGELLNPKPQGLLKSLKGGKLFFKETPFDIQEATIEFEKSTNLDPTLYCNAKTRVDEFDISLLLQGKSSAPKINLESQPTLLEQDIVSLLALGITSTNSDKITSDQQVDPTAIIGSALSQSFIGKEIKDKFGLKLQFSQAYDDDQGGSVQKITISRQVGKRIDASATRSSGKDEIIDVKLKYKFNRNLSGIIRWKDTVTNETNNLVEDNAEDGKIFGLDLEYRLEFK